MTTKHEPKLEQQFLTKNEVLRVTGLFTIWRSILFLMSMVADRFLRYQPSFPYAETILEPSGLPRWFYSWANFDGVHYLTIAEKGYVGTGLIQAFFPFFPSVLMRSLYLLTAGHINLVLTGMIITNAAALLALLLWFSFLKSQFNIQKAYVGTLLLLFFPTSFFLVTYYTESIFFAAIIGSFLLARRKHWLLAGLSCAVATGTRVVGVFLLPALLLELWLQWRSQQQQQPTLLRPVLSQVLDFTRSQWKNMLCVLVGSLGLIGYMAYLAKTFGDPLYFLHVQSEFGAGRTEGFVSYPQVLWRSIKILLTAEPWTLRYYTYVLEFLAGFIGLIGLLVASMKVRLSYIIFALGAFFTPTFTGTFSSMPRYILVCFPLYFILMNLLVDRPRLRTIILGVFSISLVVNTVMFIQGYWLS